MSWNVKNISLGNLMNSKSGHKVAVRNLRNRLESNGPLVSVVIPTYNSSRTLPQCLKSISEQTYSHVETIVIDRFSEDETENIARKFQVTLLKKGPERSVQKNFAAQLAKGDFVYFVDSDFILERAAISKCVKACKNLDGVTTINYSVGHGIWGKSIALQERFLAHDSTIQTVRFIKKKAFLKLGGFDKMLVIGEDLDLYARLREGKFRVGYSNAIEWHIGEPETLRDISRRSFYYGKGVRSFFMKRGTSGVHQLSPFKPSLFWAIIKTGSPYIFSLVIVDLTRWTSSLLGLMLSERVANARC
jgi:glycosyltransferase involved in cell wall biosynthesis